MTDTIAPALTPEEWKHERKDDPMHGEASVFLERCGGGLIYFVLRSHDTWRSERYTGAWRTDGFRAPAIMALANAALPDGDPRKITRELWYALDQVVRGQWPTDEMRVDALRVVHILAALLPSE